MNHTDVVAHRHASTESTALDRWLVRQLYRQVAPAPLRFALWDGAWSGAAAPAATIRFGDRRTLLGVSVNPDLYFGEGYMRGTLEVDADDLGDALTVLYEGLRAHRAPASRPARHWWRRSAPSARRSWANVHHHYDLGNDFYRRWLDDDMVYTCACYDRPTRTLDEAQRAKMELVCRKLALRPGDRVVEAGCGWGALARHMAARHGARVRAYNLSAEQVAYAREAAARDGLADRVEFVEDDYRAIAGTYDAFVSVGMLEHVGLAHYDTLGTLMQRVLAPGGRGVLHFIGRSHAAPLNAWIRRRIFPGAYPPTLSEVCGRVLEPHGFTVTDVENLRPHYARTLAAWRERFERAAADIARRFDARFVRAWRLYLAGSEASFRTGSVELFQVAFARDDAPVPWTRDALYASPLVD
ncbi:MAG: class I SAM-dependent methyltransferase [Vicinamibacterales bacterium]